MSFFVTSRGSGKAGNFGTLAGADQLCQDLINAANVPAAVKALTWRAYLSTTTEGTTPGIDAKDRIGPGPFKNYWLASVDPLANIAPADIFDENGAAVPQAERDIYTGTGPDGKVDPGAYAYAQQFGYKSGNCENWTNSAAFGRAFVGHVDWMSPAEPNLTMPATPSFSSAHYRNCDGNGYASGQTAGRIYCFGH
jgi:hypothetical protein